MCIFQAVTQPTWTRQVLPNVSWFDEAAGRSSIVASRTASSSSGTSAKQTARERAQQVSTALSFFEKF